MVTKIGLDLGYANITVSDVSLDVKRQPSIAIIDRSTRRIVSVGREAASYDGASGILVRPFKNGMLYSAEFTRTVIREALKAVGGSENIRCVMGVPAEFNSKQEAALWSVVSEEGVKECFFVNRAIAGLIGAGYAPSISAVSVNVGAAKTEVAVLYQGTVIYSKTVDIGGENFDIAVQSYILKHGELNISLMDARAIKEGIGSVWEGRDASPVTITGTLALTGNKIRMAICSEDILGVFEEPLRNLLAAIADGVKKIPIDYVEEIFANGIVLSGGGASLYGLDKMISKVLGIKVIMTKNPEDCVSRGLSLINGFLPIKMRSNGKNITGQLARHYKSSNKK
ncbi:MAG: hypothetical protein E7617_03020 [Ruminococcaceae bacterium]|nr:hypothetical protein [Oscillospiraceae bacterium]